MNINPEIFQLIQIMIVAFIPIIGGYLLNKYFKQREDRAILELAIRMVDKLVEKYLALYPDSDLLEIAKLVTQELIKLFNLEPEKAKSLSLGAVIQIASEDRVKSLSRASIKAYNVWIP